MTKNINEMGLEKQPVLHYYRLNPASDKGKEFLAVVQEGVEVEKKANDLVIECDAVGCVPSLYADFGGVTAFAFKRNVKPDEEVFEDSEQVTPEGHKLYEPRVKTDAKICLWENLPEDAPNIVRGAREYSIGEVLGAFPRKAIGEAVGMEVKYMHPIEALRLLGYDTKGITDYVTGMKTMKETLAGKMFVKKRDKQLMKFAIEADKEEDVFIEKTKDCKYGIYTILHGGEKAVELYKECMRLPVVPNGTLNGIVGLGNAKNRCGFFVHKNWIWVKSSEESTLAQSEDWEEVGADVWEKACAEAKALYESKEKEDKEDEEGA